MNNILNHPRLKAIKKNKWFGVIGTLLCVMAGYILLYFTMGGYMLSNDDSGIMKTVSGYSSGVPTSYHSFISTALGVFFELLYKMNPDISWYSFVYVGFIIICISSMLYVMMNAVKLKNTKMRAVCILAVTVLTINLTISGVYTVSWTETSTFFGVSALVLMFSLTQPHMKKTKAIICAVSAVFIILNALVRTSSFKAFIPFYVLTTLYVIIKNKNQYTLKTHIALFVSVVVLIGGIYQYNIMDREYKKSTYETMSRSDFEIYRVQFSDYPVIPFDGNEEFYESIGWDRELYTVAKDWMYIDRRFNTDNLRKITEMSKNLNTSVKVTDKKENIFLKLFTASMDDHQWELMTLMIVGCALMGVSGTIWCLVRKKRQYLIDSLLLFGINLLAITECLYLIYKGRYMFRVFICAALPSLIISIMIVIGMLVKIEKMANANNSAKSLPKVLSGVLMAMMIAGVLFSVVIGHQNFNIDLKINRDENNLVSREIERYCAKHQECLFIHSGVLLNDSQLFLDMSLRGRSQNLLFYGGTGVYSSGYYSIVGRYGYNEFYSDNLFDENVYFIDRHSDINDSDFMS